MLGDGDCVSILTGHQDRVRAVTVSSCGKNVYSGADDNRIIKWDTMSGKQLLEFIGHTDVVWALALSKNGAALYSGSADSTVRAWDTCAGVCTHIVSEQRGWVRALAVCPSARVARDAAAPPTAGNHTELEESLFTASLSWFIEARATHDNQLLHRIPSGVGRLDLIHALAVSNDGKTLYSGGTGCIMRGFDAETGECTKLLKGHSETVFSIILTPVEGGERLWSASADHTIRAWRLLDCQCIQVIPTSGVVRSICLSSDQCTMFSAPHRSGDIAVWKMCPRVGLVRGTSSCGGADSEFAPVDVLKGHDPREGVHSLAVSSQSGQLFSAGGDCTVRAWQVGLPDQWTKTTHRLFPKDFRALVRTVVMVANTALPQATQKPNGAESGPLEDSSPFNLLHSIHTLEPCLLENILHQMARLLCSQRIAALREV